MIKINVQCPVFDSFRVQQVGGMFDVPILQKAEHHFCTESPPPLSDDWQIGMIVGPSGSGKSTIARHLYPNDIYSAGHWPDDKAVIDHLGTGSIKEAVSLLTAVGFSSPPSWIKPYHVLSNGEQFRCDLAKALSCDGLVVYDEFTSVVDRNVAKIGSAAIAKGIKGGKIKSRFVAVTCHYDIMDWLEPDWVLDMATGTVARRLLRRPEIRLEVFRCDVGAWELFGKHHYLNNNIVKHAACYLAAWDDVPVAFCGIVQVMGFKGRRRVSRIVVLPDYQGVGIGGRFLDTMGTIKQREGFTLSITGSHPSIIRHCERSDSWRCREVAKFGYKNSYGGRGVMGKSNSVGRAVVSFDYVGKER